jgi:protein-tyrosine phosphatase
VYKKGIILFLILLPALAVVDFDVPDIAFFAYRLVFTRNFTEVVPGKLYRSGELNKNQLDHYVSTYKIKTLVDLRLQDDASDKEGVVKRQILQDNGVAFYHVHLRSSSSDQFEELKELIHVFDTAAPPFLVGCSDGVHRSGVAAAIWLMLYNNTKPDESLSQLSHRYGFFNGNRKLLEIVRGRQGIEQVLYDFIFQTNSHNGDNNGEMFRSWIDEKIIERQVLAQQGQQK